MNVAMIKVIMEVDITAAEADSNQAQAIEDAARYAIGHEGRGHMTGSSHWTMKVPDEQPTPNRDTIVEKMRNGGLTLSTLLAVDTLYSLRRVYDGQADVIDYTLVASGPIIDPSMAVTVHISQDMGRKLAGCWSQSEAGTFLGRHNMEWILECLSAGGSE